VVCYTIWCLYKSSIVHVVILVHCILSISFYVLIRRDDLVGFCNCFHIIIQMVQIYHLFYFIFIFFNFKFGQKMNG
jgi:hypothetical protein